MQFFSNVHKKRTKSQALTACPHQLHLTLVKHSTLPQVRLQCAHFALGGMFPSLQW